jgi:phosphoribosyl 1,2-cyclic phosphate phosphodiesterase
MRRLSKVHQEKELLMELVFLGTGSAWGLPEYSCACVTCKEMLKQGESRTRTSFVIKGVETILMDCGPDLRFQMWNCGVQRPDFVLITHEHGDHYLGMDDLLAFRRSVPREAWTPIPVYATEQTWQAIEVRFGYLLGSLVEKRFAEPGKILEGPKTRITPFKTFHGPTAAGSVGYVLEDPTVDGHIKLVYTSDFVRIDEEPSILLEPDVLVIQSHWLNEPVKNRPHHMSFQNAIDYIKRWRPKRATFLVHISGGDQTPGDSTNNTLKKVEPLSPLREPDSGNSYPVPRCQSEWQEVIDRIRRDYSIPGPVIVAYDGYRRTFP